MFVGSALLLTLIGIVFIYSASAYWSEVHYADDLPFYVKQMMYFALALVCFTIVSRSKWLLDEKWWFLLYVLSIVLLIAVLIPGIGVWRNGSRSWLGIGPLTFQPAEFVKITTLVYLSIVLAKWKRGERIIKLKHFIVLLLPIALIMMQPDFGSAFILIVATFILFFIANYPIKFYALCIMLGITGIVVLILSAPYRLARIQSFLDPWQDPLGKGFQAVQSLMAIGPAGLFGHGFLKSRQKYLYLPEPQNDFIFSILLEETGFIGGLCIVCIFACFLYSGYKLATHAIYVRHFYIISALVSMIAVQAALNIGVVIGLLPVTGVTLPFISYGGTSLMILWLTVGIIYLFGATTEEERGAAWKK
ncbi:FtsW/RodA/SpoVE family cell cycle protein [Lysinibacillus sp. LZ02]|uniref:FtsW/RodA/SpoVE family cell cycle protein n=1 Tax=Lysinibacillus sp. LZ02 TaxID=3420668 RepID=UPI003D3661EE